MIFVLILNKSTTILEICLISLIITQCTFKILEEEKDCGKLQTLVMITNTLYLVNVGPKIKILG
jgi:hypothetical protein